MKHIFYTLFCLICFLLPTQQAESQAIKFYASSDATQILQNNLVELRFTLENGEGRNFVPPEFNGFQVYSGPNSSTQMTIVNGAMSRKMSYSYSLLALEKGNFTIGSASVRVGNKTYQTGPIKIEVLESRDTGAAEDVQELFVELEISDTIAYIGQQISLRYVIYTTKNVNSVDFIKEPEYEGFFVRMIRNYTEDSKRVVINGVQYLKKTLRYIALFPQQTGNFPIESAILNLGIPINDSQFNFFTTRLKYERASTKPGNIEVIPLPGDPPVSFSGAIGKFSMSAGVDKKSIMAEDAFTLRINIRGGGDAKYIQPPIQSFEETFEVYDPNILKDESREIGDKIFVEKQFEYLVVPKVTGNYVIRPEFSYFDTDSGSYITLSKGPFPIQVTSNGNNTNVRDMKGESVIKLLPLMPDSSLRKKSSYFLFSPLYWSLAAIPVLGIIAMFILKWRQLKKAAADPVLVKQAEAKKLALLKMKSANLALEQNMDTQFYEEINNGLFGYASDKFVIPQSSLTRDAIRQSMGQHSISISLVDRMIALMDVCQMALYAATPEKSKQDIYAEALRIIIDIESETK